MMKLLSTSFGCLLAFCAVPVAQDKTPPTPPATQVIVPSSDAQASSTQETLKIEEVVTAQPQATDLNLVKAFSPSFREQYRCFGEIPMPDKKRLKKVQQDAVRKAAPDKKR